MELIEDPQFAELAQIANNLPVGGVEFRGQNPAKVRPPGAVNDGRMGVVLGVRVFVEMAVMRRPPERTFLQSGATETGQAILKDAASPIRLVREMPVVA